VSGVGVATDDHTILRTPSERDSRYENALLLSILKHPALTCSHLPTQELCRAYSSSLLARPDQSGKQYTLIDLFSSLLLADEWYLSWLVSKIKTASAPHKPSAPRIR